MRESGFTALCTPIVAPLSTYSHCSVFEGFRPSSDITTSEILLFPYFQIGIATGKGVNVVREAKGGNKAGNGLLKPILD